MINKINFAGTSCDFGKPKIDEEHRQIIKKLFEKYGLRSTGSKSGDKALLRRKEIEEAEKLDTPHGNFLVLNRSEVSQIIEKKKKKKIEANPEAFQNTMQGQKLLAEQMMVYIQMNSNIIQ